MYNIYIHRYPNVHIVAQTRGKRGGESVLGRRRRRDGGGEEQYTMDMSVSTLLNKDYAFFLSIN